MRGPEKSEIQKLWNDISSGKGEWPEEAGWRKPNSSELPSPPLF